MNLQGKEEKKKNAKGVNRYDISSKKEKNKKNSKTIGAFRKRRTIKPNYNSYSKRDEQYNEKNNIEEYEPIDLLDYDELPR